MKAVLIIILIVLLLPVIVCVTSLVYTIFMLITGKMTKRDLSEKVAKNKAKKTAQEATAAKYKKTRIKSSTHWLSYPSPLNNWGLWN